ncbi:MAG: DUF3341 domain-containing protein [Acidobacteriota bacterium]
MSTPTVTAASRSELFGVLAEFSSVEELLAACEKVRDAGFTRWDAHSPIPVHGLDEAMGLKGTRLPAVVLAGGVFGALGGLALQWWTNGVNYAYRISGKPLFALPPAIPITFEMTVLFAALGAVGGLIIANGWPHLYHPLFNSAAFRRVTADRFFISIEADDPLFDEARTRAFLESLGSGHIEEVEG